MSSFASRIASFGACALMVCAASAQAAYNSPISFAQSGTLLLTLEFSTGGFDHFIQQTASTDGSIVDAPLMATTESGGSPSALVLGFAPSNPGDSLALGDYIAGDEVVLRLTNVESDRLGTPGTIAGSVFTGSANGSNANPDFYNTFVEVLSPTSVRVTFEDLFAVDPSTSLDPDGEFLGGRDVVVTLSVVPEPQSYALMLMGLLMVSWVARGKLVMRVPHAPSGSRLKRSLLRWSTPTAKANASCPACSLNSV